MGPRRWRKGAAQAALAGDRRRHLVRRRRRRGPLHSPSRTSPGPRHGAPGRQTRRHASASPDQPVRRWHRAIGTGSTWLRPALRLRSRVTQRDPADRQREPRGPNSLGDAIPAAPPAAPVQAGHLRRRLFDGRSPRSAGSPGPARDRRHHPEPGPDARAVRGDDAPPWRAASLDASAAVWTPQKGADHFIRQVSPRSRTSPTVVPSVNP